MGKKLKAKQPSSFRILNVCSITAKQRSPPSARRTRAMGAPWGRLTQFIRQFEGLFGRLFRTLPAAVFPEEDLVALARAMTAEPEGMRDGQGKPQRDGNGHLIR